MNDLMRMSQSRLRTYQECLRKDWLQNIRRLAPRLYGPVGPLQSGTRVHEALEAYYTPGSTTDPRQALEHAIGAALVAYDEECAKIDVEPDAIVLEKFRKDTDLERAMVEGYFEWLADSGEDASLRFVAAEEQISITADQLGADFGRPVEVVGKIDARAVDEVTGYTLFIDHKTVKDFTSILPTLQGDPQMLHYHLLLAITRPAEHVDGALYNMLRKVKRGPRSKPPYYMRETIVHNAAEIESYRLRLIGLITTVIEFEERVTQLGDLGPKMFAPPTKTRDCSWKCEFFNVCDMFDDGSRVEAALAEMYVERDPLARYTTSRDTLLYNRENDREEMMNDRSVR